MNSYLSVRNSQKQFRPAIPLAALIACLALAAGSAQARGLTRNEVLADLQQARIRGDLIEAGEITQSVGERSPNLHPVRYRASPVTRAQVVAQFTAARASGDIQGPGEDGRTLREQMPGSYPSRPVAPLLPRQQVLADLEAARRSGDMLAGGESGLTLRELMPDLYPAQQCPMTSASTARPDAQSRLPGHRSEFVPTAS